MLTTLTREQKAIRATGISATDLVKLSGLAPAYMGGPIAVYIDKTEGPRIETDADASEDILRGIFNEPATRQWFAWVTKREVREPGTMINEAFPLLRATPDGISWDPAKEDDERILEIKAPRFPFDWTDDAPAHYRIQTQVQMGIAELDEADIVAQLGGGLRIFPQRFNRPLFDDLRELAERFWRDHIQARRPPAPDATKAYGDWLSKRHPEDLTADLLEAPQEAVAWVEQYREACEIEKLAAEKKRLARNNLIAMIGDHAGLQAEGMKVTYRKSKDSTSTDHKAIVEACREIIPAEIISAHTKQKSGHRSIKVY